MAVRRNDVRAWTRTGYHLRSRLNVTAAQQKNRLEKISAADVQTGSEMMNVNLSAPSISFFLSTLPIRPLKRKIKEKLSGGNREMKRLTRRRWWAGLTRDDCFFMCCTTKNKGNNRSTIREKQSYRLSLAPLRFQALFLETVLLPVHICYRKCHGDVFSKPFLVQMTLPVTEMKPVNSRTKQCQA